jgi:hypothetical protein
MEGATMPIPPATAVNSRRVSGLTGIYLLYVTVTVYKSVGARPGRSGCPP